MRGRENAALFLKFAILIYMDKQTQTLLKYTSRSLYLSARILPRTIRDAFGIAYLLCRYADSIADTPLLPPQRRLYWIAKYPQMIALPNEKEQKELVKEICGSSDNPYEKELLENLPCCLRAFQALSPLQQQAVLEVARQVCDGMQMDLQTFPAENSGQIAALQTAQDLEHYCHLMGGAPGVFWSTLITQTVRLPIEKERLLLLGRNIGDALQIVNILRDLPKDLRIGRCYFPLEELAPLGLTPQDLLEPKNSPRFEPIKQKWIYWGLSKLQSAFEYIQALPKTQLQHRAAVTWPVLWTADTLYKVYQEQNLLDPNHRVKIPRRVIYKTMLLSPFVLPSNRLFAKWLENKMALFPPSANTL